MSHKDATNAITTARARVSVLAVSAALVVSTAALSPAVAETAGPTAAGNVSYAAGTTDPAADQVDNFQVVERTAEQAPRPANPVTAQQAGNISQQEPHRSPPGANDWHCKPTGQNPYPVVLIHGTWGSAYNTFAGLSAELKADGHCVYATNFGAASVMEKGGIQAAQPAAFVTGDIAESAAEMGEFIDRVLASTGAEQANLVGHSQGGVVARQYTKFNGGADKVNHFVTLGATNNGTTMNGISELHDLVFGTGVDIDTPLDHIVGVAGMQQLGGSPFITELNADGHTVPGIDYTVIGSVNDQVSTPYEATFLEAGPGSEVDNVTLQHSCAIDQSDHSSMMYSSHTYDIVREALAPGTVPEDARRCTAHS